MTYNWTLVIFYKRFVDLKVAAGLGALIDMVVKWFKPHGHLFDDVALALATDLDAEALELLFEAIKGAVIEVFT